MRWRTRAAERSITIGVTQGRFRSSPFRLDAAAIGKHKHIIGLTGEGKSNLLALLFLELHRLGIGVTLIDPHGDLSQSLLRHLADAGYFTRPDAFDRLWYVKFNRTDRFVPFNFLKQDTADAYTIANQFIEVCTRVWSSGLSDNAAPQFENVMTAAVITLVSNGLALTDLEALLTNRDWRDQLLLQVPDPRIVAYFHNRYDRWGRDQQQLIESTLRREFLLTANPALRNALGQRDNLFQCRAILDSNISVILNLGGLHKKVKQYLGALLMVSFEEGAFSREDLHEEDRSEYHLLIDEFPLFSATTEEGMTDILSLARKYGLKLTLAHQNWSQVSSRLKGAIQNCLEIMLKLGDDDAVWAAPRLARVDPYRIKHEVVDATQVDKTHPVYESIPEQYVHMAEELTTLALGQAYIKIGSLRQKVQTRYLGKPTASYETLAALEEDYARRLMRPRNEVEQQVNWQLVAVPDKQNPQAARRDRRMAPLEDEAA